MKLAFALALALLLLPFASAGFGCVQDVEGEVAVGPFYVWLAPCDGTICGVSLWIYEESNGIEGLQINGYGPGPCYPWTVDGDTVVF